MQKNELIETIYGYLCDNLTYPIENVFPDDELDINRIKTIIKENKLFNRHFIEYKKKHPAAITTKDLNIKDIFKVFVDLKFQIDGKILPNMEVARIMDVPYSYFRVLTPQGNTLSKTRMKALVERITDWHPFHTSSAGGVVVFDPPIDFSDILTVSQVELSPPLELLEKIKLTAAENGNTVQQEILSILEKHYSGTPTKKKEEGFYRNLAQLIKEFLHD